MKPVMSLPVISVLLVFAAISAPDAVCGNPVDSAGTGLKRGVRYYILPARPPLRGGFIPQNLIRKTSLPSCPLDRIFQLRLPTQRGIPVTFIPQNPSVQFIPFSHNLNINFSSDRWFCRESKFWTVKFSPADRGLVVTTGGTFRGSNSWFRIERHGAASKLVHCPHGTTPCRDVGLNTRRLYLALNNRPLAVRFQRAGATDPSDEALSKEALSEEALSEEAIPEEAIPEEAISEEAIPEEASAEEAIPEEPIPEEAMLRMFPFY